jgi:ribosomal protein S18 acetylase RimI-like enzyme
MSESNDNTTVEQSITPKKKKLAWEVGAITKANIKQLRLINIHTLPVRYSDKFYDELLDRYDNTFLKYAFASGFAIGAICARIEKEENSHVKLYLMTLNVFTAYRRYGIGK